MPDPTMEAKHIESFERIRQRLLDLRAHWVDRLETQPGAIQMVAELDSSLQVNAHLMRLAREEIDQTAMSAGA